MGKASSKWVKALRDQLGGISQAELARRLAVTPSTVARWEAGQSEPRQSEDNIRRAATTGTGVGSLAAGLAAVGSAGGPVGLLAGAALGALGGIKLHAFLRNAARLGLTLEQVADLLDDRPRNHEEGEAK